MEEAKTNRFRVGIDIGGTFTDIIFIGENGSTLTKKVLSTPDDYSRGILTGISEILVEKGLSGSSIEEVVHGSTIVTNACIELTGAKVGLITTKGFRDVLELGRGRMPVMYDLSWQKPVPLAPRYLRLELDERVNGKGEILKPLNIDEAKAAINRLLSHGVESIAVCLFNSPKNPIHEQKLGQLIKEMAPEIYVSLSTEVMPLLKEYERSSETAVNAYVMPLVATYLRALRQNLTDNGVGAPLYIMQSNGGMITPEVAAERPVEIIECGPAAGVVGAAYLAQQQNIGNLITFDMGGTTCKASIVEDGQFTRSPEYEIGGGIHKATRLLKGKGYVVRVPSIDIAEIGAGGGSILWIDIGGILRVGPRSAGAVPGPACYNRGGEEPTLTDANVVLGYLNPDYLCGGELKLDKEKAFRAIEEKTARPLGMSAVEAAYGAYCLTNANMMRAIRAVSSERGRDPRLFTLYAFGGAGAVHAVGVARELDIKKIIVPPVPGVCSAFGLLCADIERHYILAFSHAWDSSLPGELNHLFAKMTEEAVASAERWAGRTGIKPRIDRYVDLRYKGQSSELSIPIPEDKMGEAELTALTEAFEVEHEKTYGHRLPGYPFEVHSVRLTATIPTRRPSLTRISGGTSPLIAGKKTQGNRKAYWGKQHGTIATPVLTLEQVGPSPSQGPILVDCYDTTIVVPPGGTIEMGDWGNIVINIKSRES
ncbi:MAG: hydantoinase/oxoprolinase family protein [Dehalococcoidia bacterium]|nr:hydantoinase/oxoprolinase family protein [Dehalococcoidia bacterium]